MATTNSAKHLQLPNRCLFFLITLGLTGCVTHRIKEAAWPEELPPRVYFMEQYQHDLANKHLENQDEYLIWITRFYQGWELYPNGWNNITKDVLLRQKNPQTADKIKANMSRLGILISGEWAKNNQTRLINTRHVSVWGNALLKSLDHDETLQVIDRVAKDIDDLLTRKISADTITADRYYAQDEDIAF
jgi:hypothetical protein